MTDDATSTSNSPTSPDRYRARAQHLGQAGRLVVFAVAVLAVVVVVVALFAGDTRVLRPPVVEEVALAMGHL